MDSIACSVVLCTYNRLAYLNKSLPALLDLDYLEYEVVVVNDGSLDGTREYLDNLQHPKLKVIHHEKNCGLSLARNTGIERARHTVVAFTDDDCVPHKEWLHHLAAGFKNDSVGLVMGQTFYIAEGYRGYFPERLVKNIGAKWPMGCNMAYRKEVFQKCGGFDPNFFYYNNEDSEMAIRAVAAGFNYTRVLKAVVYHQAMDWTISSLLRSARNAAVWPLLKKKYPQQYRVFGPPVMAGLFVQPRDYMYFLFLPVLIPVLWLRYLYHGKKDWRLFLCKWPVYLFMRRWYIYKEAIRNRVWMV